VLKRLIAVANYYGVLPLTDKQQQEWSLLDAFDMLSPEYDNPQAAKTAKAWMENAGFREIEVFKAGHLVARGQK
jgi:hypothetical protein